MTCLLEEKKVEKLSGNGDEIVILDNDSKYN